MPRLGEVMALRPRRTRVAAIFFSSACRCDTATVLSWLYGQAWPLEQCALYSHCVFLLFCRNYRNPMPREELRELVVGAFGPAMPLTTPVGLRQ